MAPLLGARVIPAGWSEHHASVLVTAASGSCFVWDPARSGPGVLDPATGERGPRVLFETAGGASCPLACRVVAYQSDRATEQAGQESTSRTYLVQIPDPTLTGVTGVREGHMLRVVCCPDDPTLVGEDLRVSSVQAGTERFVRDVWCVRSHHTAGGDPS